jgi:hypothetical protein
MAQAAYEMARLTCSSKPIDGVGGGGVSVDNLTVAGALAFRHPKTGDKLSNLAECLARYVYCDDISSKQPVVNTLFLRSKRHRTKIAPATLMRIVRAALEEYKTPQHTRTGIEIAQRVKPVSRANIAREIGIARQSYSDTHHHVYETAFQFLAALGSEADQHIQAAMTNG